MVRCMDENGFIKRLKTEVAKHGNQKKTAAALGISQQFLTDVLKGRRQPGEKLLAALGLEKRIEFVKAK
jgi:transcriptional regulator with XRE-family HTH domain